MERTEVRKDYSNSYFVRAVETLFRIKLSGLPLHFSYAFGVSAGRTLAILLIVYAVNMIYPSPLGVSTLPEIELFLMIALIFFSVAFLPNYIAHICERTIGINKWARIVGSVFVFAVSIYALFKVFDVDYHISQIYDSCETSNCVESSIGVGDSEKLIDSMIIGGKSAEKELPREEVSTSEPLLDIGEDMSVSEVDQLLHRLGLEQFSVIRRGEIFKSAFDVSLDDFLTQNEEKDMSGFFSELDEVASTTPVYTQMYIMKGLMISPSLDTAIEIINRGHSIDGNHVTLLAQNLTVNEIMELENYGVNFAETSFDGSNALISSLFNEPSSGAFEYLLNKEGMLDSSNVDVIREIMVNSNLLGRDFSYAQQAIEKGGSLSQETIMWLESDVQQLYPEYYNSFKEFQKNR